MTEDYVYLSNFDEKLKKVIERYRTRRNRSLNTLENTNEEELFRRALLTLLDNDDVFIPIPISRTRVKSSENELLSEKNRLKSLEESVSKLERDFDIYLKYELKEESNKVLLNMIRDNDDVKEVHMKLLGNTIRYYIIYEKDSYFDFLEDITDLELKLEDSYPMLNFEFIHYNVNEMENINLSGCYMVHSKRG